MLQLDGTMLHREESEVTTTTPATEEAAMREKPTQKEKANYKITEICVLHACKKIRCPSVIYFE